MPSERTPAELPVSNKKTFPKFYLLSPTIANLYPSKVQAISFIAPIIADSISNFNYYSAVLGDQTCTFPLESANL